VSGRLEAALRLPIINYFGKRAVRQTIADQQRQALLTEIDGIVNPPPEPDVIYVEAAEGSDQLGTSDFNPKLWMQKPRSWW
jgi:hypothetical protein